MRSASNTMTKSTSVLLVAIGVVIAAIVANVVLQGRDVVMPPDFIAASRPPSGGGVVVYYEVLDADGALLYERVLDGVSLPRFIVERPSSDFSRTYTVDPPGRTALASISAEGKTTLEAIDIAAGTTLWTVQTPILEQESGVWSADGRRWAALVAEVDFAAGPSVLIADIASGATALVALNERAWPQGFTSTGTLVLTERADDFTAAVPWRFVAIDAATGGLLRLSSPPSVGPHSVYADDVAPAQGIGVTHFPLDEEDIRTTIQVRDLKGGQWRPLADFETVDRLLFAPAGDVIAAEADGKTVLVDLAGRVTELWDGPDYSELIWSASGQYLGVSGWDERSVVAVIERSTGRVIELPLPESIAEGRLVAIVGREPLPAIALPPGGDPAPSPPPEPTGPPIAGAPGILVGWIERVDDIPVAHVEVRQPTEDGGIRTVATMPPIVFDDLEGQEATLSAVARPTYPDVLVKVDSDGLTRAWLWDPSAGRQPFPFPEGWPPSVGRIVWRPDGQAIASEAFDAGAGADAVLVVAELDTSIVRQLAVPDEYSILEGWWSNEELRVGHDICTEGCPGRFAYSARLGVDDGRLRPFGPDERPQMPIHLPLVEFEPLPEIILSSINALAADDIRVSWPVALPAIDGNIALWAGAGRDLLVGAPASNGIDLYRIEDPIGRARDGRLERPAPTFVATLPPGAEAPQASPDGRWLLVSDRTGGKTLVELDLNRQWSLGPGRGAEWGWLVTG
jgi:hypothetical protein